MTKRYADMSPEAAELYQQLRDEGMNVPKLGDLQEYREAVRAGFESSIQAAVSVFEGVIEIIEINGVRCRQLTPQGWQDGRCMLYAYGGGYVSGSTYEDQILTAPLAQHSGARIIMPEYRLSPEHPYPEPQQDMQQVYRALLPNPEPNQVIAGGE